MKKFLAILLIAIVACSNVAVIEEEEFDLQGFFSKIKNAIKWLKDQGLYDTIISSLKTVGKTAAYALCQKFIKSDTCKLILNL